jgi:hypothetical protein
MNPTHDIFSAYYVPSGRLPPRAVTLTLRCAVAVVPVAWLYAWLTIRLPLVLNLGAVLAFALAMGLATRYAARCGQARNPVWMGRLGLALGLVGWYAQAAAWIAILETDGAPGASMARHLADFAAVLADPTHVLHVGLDAIEAGVYSIAGMRVRGAALAAIWLAEFALLAGVPYALGRMTAAEPFCEKTGGWMPETELPRKFAHIDHPATAIALLADEPEQFFRLLQPCGQDDPARYAVLIVYRGSGDPFVSIKNVVVRVDKDKDKDKRRESRELVIDYLRLPGIDPEAVMAHGAHEDSAAAAEAETEAPSMHDAPADPPQLAAALAHLTADRFDAALALALPYVAARADDLRIDAVRVCALCTARLGRWDESLRYWSMLFGEERSAHNALNVGTSFAMSGDPVHGRDWIARARALNLTSREMPDLQIVTNFITALTQSGHMAQALPYLDEVREVYVDLRNTDPTFLHTRNVPFFGVFLEHSAPVVRAVLGAERGHAWYASMLPHLDQHGQDELSAWLAAQAFPLDTPAAA